MPFSTHNRSSSSSNSTSNNAQQPQFSATAGIFQAAQALGSIGAPSANLRDINSGTTTAGTDILYSNTASSQGLHSQRSRAYSHGFALTVQLPDTAPKASDDDSSKSNLVGAGSRAYPQQLGELLPDNDVEASRRQQPSSAPRLESKRSSSADFRQQALIHLAPRLEGSADPARPTIPILPSNMADPYTASPRSASQTHSYSRSSPNAGGYDGGFGPFSGGSGQDTSSYASPSTSKYTPQGHRNVSNTPLGLADIRPRADSSVNDNLPGSNPYSYDGASAQPTNSNYLAPWAIYAFDWCKWPAQGHDAGKVAVGSYLEDGHNFVRR